MQNTHFINTINISISYVWTSIVSIVKPLLIFISKLFIANELKVFNPNFNTIVTSQISKLSYKKLIQFILLVKIEYFLGHYK